MNRALLVLALVLPVSCKKAPPMLTQERIPRELRGLAIGVTTIDEAQSQFPNLKWERHPHFGGIEDGTLWYGEPAIRSRDSENRIFLIFAERGGKPVLVSMGFESGCGWFSENLESTGAEYCEPDPRDVGKGEETTPGGICFQTEERRLVEVACYGYSMAPTWIRYKLRDEPLR